MYELASNKDAGLLARAAWRGPKPTTISMKRCPIITQEIDKALIPSKHAKWSPFGGSVLRSRLILAYNPKFKKKTCNAVLDDNK